MLRSLSESACCLCGELRVCACVMCGENRVYAMFLCGDCMGRLFSSMMRNVGQVAGGGWELLLRLSRELWSPDFPLPFVAVFLWFSAV